MTNLALMSRRRADAEDRELLWDVPLTAAYVLTAAAAAALEASFADGTGAVAVVILLITALRNSWMVTLAIAGRRRS